MFAQTIARAVGGKVFLFAPHGPVFAVYVSGTERNNVFDFFLENLPTVSGGVMFFRFEPEHPIGSGLLKSKIKKTIDLNPHQTLILNLGQSVEELLAEMKPKTRYNIRLAEKSGVEVRVLQELPIPAVGGDDPIAASAKRAGIRAYSHAYFNDLLKFFNEHPGPIQARCYAAYHEGDLLAANIMLEYGETAIYLFGGSLELKRNLMPSYALHFQAIQDAKSRGCKHYDFWGVETDENHPWYGFSKFKLGFGGRIIERPGTLDFVYNSAWYNAYGIVRKLNRLKNLRFRN
jgi:lipid II:glycine glycyltransferase (peptidoglycan interpeptide bridge formation enzyme)